MPVFPDGAQNLSALTVPAVYVDIVPPNAFIAGTPTNIEGLIGAASWGIPNSLIPVSKNSDAALKIGPPVVRSYDMSSYVAAATYVGSSIGFYCVRVTDGTDVAATATIQSGALTLTAACTGILGNQIQYSLQNGSLANSLMGIVAFPGLVPEQFNNIVGPTPAAGTVTFTANPVAASTLVIAGSSVSFVASGPTGLQVLIGADLAHTLSNLLAFLQASADTGLVKCLYSLSGSVLTISANQFAGTGTGAGTGGNALTLTTTVTGATASGATLLGGVGTWQTFWTNLASVINNGNTTRGASTSVVATAGVSTLVPVLSTVTALSGGTDGATGLTDAMLMGQDIVPRKGMYVLRNSNADCFTLCDISTSSDYAAMASFAVQETMYALVAGPKSETIASAIATRTNSGIDTSWLKYILGDWPTFYDSYNQVSRLISPAAFGIGIFGNLSPEQSPLNKPLQGVTATQRSTQGQTYSDTELSQINTGGIDAIMPASQSPGGYYFSFASGRNASSNTAANGDEYTRLTNFLARAAQSKAAGSFIGKLQSIKPNDQTRANAKALFDGFSAQLASPEVGAGINGNGMIDSPWAVTCDLTNNPPNLQAMGYLFLYWQVRYLSVIRYFVIKLQGGSNVTVTVQSTQPSPAQFAQSANTSV